MAKGPRWIAQALAALVVVAVLGVAASAMLDRPARTFVVETTVAADRQALWRAVTDFAAYERWNPVMTRAAGDARPGARLTLRLEIPGHEAAELNAEVSIVKPERKLRWQDRLYVPGLRDREYEIVVAPSGKGRWLVRQRMRIEGLLVPLRDSAGELRALELLAQSLVERVRRHEPAPTGGTRIVVKENWNCTRPLASYGRLPIIVESRIDNRATQPESVDAVSLTGRQCRGDGDPATIDLILRIEGDGGSTGPTADAVKLRGGPGDLEIAGGPSDLQITGYANCGAPAPRAHQDGIQAMLGYRVTFVEFEIGDVDARSPTCDGAGGGLFIEERKTGDPLPEDVLCVRCTIVTRNHGLLVGDSVRSGARDSTFVSGLRVAVQPEAVDPVNDGNRWIPLGEGR